MGDTPNGLPGVNVQLPMPSPDQLVARARQRFGEVHDSLLYTVILAEAGDQGSQRDLGMLLDLLERAQTARRGISSGRGVQIIPPR